MTRPIPEGLHSVTPHISVDGAAEAIAFYTKAFGAVEKQRAPDPTGKKIWHAEISIGDSAIFVNDVFPEMGMGDPSRASLWIYTDGVDAAWKRAVDAGATVTMPLADQFWGDRTGSLKDKWGIQWTLGQRIRDQTREETDKRAQEFIAQMKQGK